MSLNSVVPRSRFLGDTGVPYLNFRGTFANSGGHIKSISFLPVKLKSFLEISVYFYLNLSSMSIVLAQEGVKITVR